MNHNIVIDDDGNEHQAVDGTYKSCAKCSLKNIGCSSIKGSECTSDERADSMIVIYKRKIKLSDIIIKS